MLCFVFQLEYSVSYTVLQEADELRGSNANCLMACGFFDQEGGMGADSGASSDGDSDYPGPEEDDGGDKRILTTMLGGAAPWASRVLKALLHYPSTVRLITLGWEGGLQCFFC